MVKKILINRYPKKILIDDILGSKIEGDKIFLHELNISNIGLTHFKKKVLI